MQLPLEARDLAARALRDAHGRLGEREVEGEDRARVERVADAEEVEREEVGGRAREPAQLVVVDHL